MAKRLTEVAVERLGIKKHAYEIGDALATGLRLRVTPAGRKIWVLQTVFPGYKLQTTRTLGRYPGMGVTEAREKAGQWYALVKAGRDPAEYEVEQQQKLAAIRRTEALKQAHTFASVAERYIAEHVTGQRRAKDSAREIRTGLVSVWGERPIASITPADVKTLINTIKVRAPYQAQNIFGHCRTLFAWCVHNDLLELSPVASLKKKWVLSGAKITPRQRTLDNTEVAAFWRATGRLGYPYEPLYRMLLLTGCRLNEVARATWSEFNPDLRRTIRDAQRQHVTMDWTSVPDNAKLWTIPRERFKSDTEHLVPLSDDACAILVTLPRFAHGDYLFTFTDGEKPLHSLGSNTKEYLDHRMQLTLRAMARRLGDDRAQVKQIKLEGWVNHDLRRTVRTNLSELRIPDHVAEICLGHGRRGLQRVYDQHTYLSEIREALTCWATKLSEIVGPTTPTPPVLVIPDNVVKLQTFSKA